MKIQNIPVSLSKLSFESIDTKKDKTNAMVLSMLYSSLSNEMNRLKEQREKDQQELRKSETI
jgi:hypothetical protein